jgi:histidyl-tRNA synthetase
MIEQLGGPAVPAIGFAMGLERLLLAAGAVQANKAPLCFFAPIGAAATRQCLLFARELRSRGHTAEVDGRGGSLKSLLRRADSLGARCAVVLGDTELAANTVVLKDLDRHTQVSVAFKDVPVTIQKILQGTGDQPTGDIA